MIDWKRYKSYPISHFSEWRRWVYFFTILFVVAPKIRKKATFKTYGTPIIPKNRPLIVASNHISYEDPPMVSLSLFHPIAYMAKKELFEKSRWWAEFYRMQGTFALDREAPDSATLKTALNVLKTNGRWALGIFPEGTRSKTGEVMPLKKGIGSLAQKSGAAIIPIGIYREADSDNRYIVTIGEPITDVSDAEAVQQKVYDALVHLSDPSWERDEHFHRWGFL